MAEDAPTSDDAEPDILGAGQTEALTRSRRAELRAHRRHAKRAHRFKRVIPLDSEVVSVYEPHVRYVPPLRPYLHDLWARRTFALALARSKVKGTRANTALGGLWALIDPLFMVALYYFLFTVLRGGSRPAEFIPVIICGILHFQVAAAALNEGANSVSGAANLMLNSTFPRMLLPLSAILGGIVKFLPSIPIIFGAAWLLDAHIGLSTLWWFVLFPLQITIGLGLALLVSTAVVFFRDVKNVLSYVSRILFFTSPVIWPVDLLSEDLLKYVRLMPFFGVFANYQHILGDEPVDYTSLAIATTWGIGTVLIGAWLFLRHEREFATKL